MGATARIRLMSEVGIGTDVPANRAKWFKGFTDALFRTYNDAIHMLDSGYGIGFSAGLRTMINRNIESVEKLAEDCDRLLAENDELMDRLF